MSDIDHVKVKKSNSLQDAFGNEIELIAEDGSVKVFELKAEFQLGDHLYAALQTDAKQGEDEVDLFRVIHTNGEPQLETIDDDEEWEAVSEAYDDLWFQDDEQP